MTSASLADIGVSSVQGAIEVLVAHGTVSAIAA